MARSVGIKLAIGFVLLLSAIGLGFLLFFGIKGTTEQIAPVFTEELTGNPIRVPPGGVFTLTWNVQNADQVILQNGKVDVTGKTSLEFPVTFEQIGELEFVLVATKYLPGGGQKTTTSSWTGYVNEFTAPQVYIYPFYASQTYYRMPQSFASSPNPLTLNWVINTTQDVQKIQLQQNVMASYSGKLPVLPSQTFDVDLQGNLPGGSYTISPSQFPVIETVLPYQVEYTLLVTNTDNQTVQSGTVDVQVNGTAPTPTVSLWTSPDPASIDAGDLVYYSWNIVSSGEQQLSLAEFTVNDVGAGFTPTFNSIGAQGSQTIPSIQFVTFIIIQIQTGSSSSSSSDNDGTQFFNFVIRPHGVGITNMTLHLVGQNVSYDPAQNYTGFCPSIGLSNIPHCPIGTSTTGDFMANFYAVDHSSLFACVQYSDSAEVGITNLAVAAGPQTLANSLCPPGNSNPQCTKGTDLNCSTYTLSNNVICPYAADPYTSTTVWTKTPIPYVDTVTGTNAQVENLQQFTKVNNTKGGYETLDNPFNGEGVPTWTYNILCTQEDPNAQISKNIMLASFTPADQPIGTQPTGADGTPITSYNSTVGIPVAQTNAKTYVTGSDSFPVAWSASGSTTMSSVVKSDYSSNTHWAGLTSTIWGNFLYVSSNADPGNLECES